MCLVYVYIVLATRVERNLGTTSIFSLFHSLRIKELFEILVEYPDSKPSLDDLKDCLDRVELRASLIKSLRDMCVNMCACVYRCRLCCYVDEY